MTLKDIKESGLLEEYVFGNPSQENIVRVDNWINIHPELKAYIFDLELIAEKLAQDNSISPPDPWKTEILSDPGLRSNEVISKSYTKWIRLAASLIIGALIGIGFMYSTYYQKVSDFDMLQSKYAQLSADCSNDKVLIANSEKLLDYIQDVNTEAITLRQTSNKQNNAIVFWNQQEKRALASIEGLAPITSSESYQIWADVNGEMISIGLLEQQTNRFVALQYVDKAESLNITIEPKGGSTHPTISRLVMSAKV